MTGLSRADEVVIGDVEPLPEILELWGEPIALDLRIDAGLLCRVLHLLTMFVQAGEEKDVLSAQPCEPRQDVSRHGGVGVADVRHIVHIINGSGDVEGIAHMERKITGGEGGNLG